MKRKGISLIVLIITIIVVIILAVTVILTLSKNNPIESAKEATFKEDIRAYQDELNMYIAKEYQQSAGMRDWKITATEYEKDSTKENYNNSVYKYLNSFKKKYENKLAIKDDMIAYVGFDEKEKNWLLNSGIYMSKKFTVQYINEYGEKLFPDEEIAELDTEYVFYPKEKEGYISLQPEISGTAAENTTVTFEYCKICDDLAFIGLDSNGNETTDESLIQKYTVSGIGDCQNTWVAIPRTHNDKDVIKVKQGAFANTSNIKRMVICDNIEDVGRSAFYRCGIEKLFVDVKSKLTGTYIFEECRNLKKAILGSNVSFLPGEIFLRCNKLESIQFYTEQNISFGNTRFFDECTSLKQFLVNSKNRKYKSIDGVLYTKDGKNLVLFPNAKVVENCSFDLNLENINSFAFMNNYNVKNVLISNKVGLGGSVFENSNIESVVLDSSKNLVNSFIFIRCYKLNNIKLGKEISEFPYATFSECKNLQSIEFTTEKDIKILNTRVFENCKSLKTITVNEDNKKYKSVDGVLYTKDGSKLVVYPVGKTDEVYTLSTDVKEVCSYVFSYSNIKTINYEGTMEDWNNVIKQNNWNYGGVVKTIHCTDGDITL